MSFLELETLKAIEQLDGTELHSGKKDKGVLRVTDTFISSIDQGVASCFTDFQECKDRPTGEAFKELKKHLNEYPFYDILEEYITFYALKASLNPDYDQLPREKKMIT